MKGLKKILAAVSAVTMMTGMVSAMSVSADEYETGLPTPTEKDIIEYQKHYANNTVDEDDEDYVREVKHVVTRECGSGVFLDYDIYLSNEQYKVLSGTKRKLRYGDVIGLRCKYLLLTLPMQVPVSEDTSARYLGTVTEVYKDDIKDLTVTKKGNGDNSDYYELTDSEGNVYTWNTYMKYTFADGTFFDSSSSIYAIDPRTVNVGDVLSCAVTSGDQSRVILPVNVVSKNSNTDAPVDNTDDTTIHIIYKSGDANHDGKVNVRDCALIASAVADRTTDSLPASADYNKDGYKNIRDAAALASALSKKE